MTIASHRFWLAGVILLGFAGCDVISGSMNEGANPDVTDLATKATDIASAIGGFSGFGGTVMSGYLEHAPNHMGFSSDTDLASADGTIMLQIQNETGQDAEFHISYIASHMGLDEQMMDVFVHSNGEISVEMPCSEIIGLGSLSTTGVAACHLEDDEAVANDFVVPGFLGLDYSCGATYGCTLEQDVDDLDADGDTEEFIVVSDGFEFHMANDGPGGHMHGSGFGMMGPHFNVMRHGTQSTSRP